MAMVEQRICDVYGTAYRVSSYRVRVLKVDDDGQVDEDDPVVDHAIDLSEKGYRRFAKLLNRGLTPPVPRKPKQIEN